MQTRDKQIERARFFGRTSLGFGIAALMLPWSNLSKGTAIVWTSLGLGIVGVFISLAGLDARRAAQGSKPGEPMAGLIASLMAIFMCGVLWFIDLAMAQHGPRP
jgi:hypothetical protein